MSRFVTVCKIGTQWVNVLLIGTLWVCSKRYTFDYYYHLGKSDLVGTIGALIAIYRGFIVLSCSGLRFWIDEA